MNPLNYASLEASKRLVEAGIMLETEQYHTIETYEDSQVWCEVPTEGTDARPRPIKIKVITTIPAPSMAEVWRELPETALQPCRDTTTGYCHEYLSLQKDGDLTVAGYGEYSEIGRNSNPTDALIDLLIWVKKEANHA